MFARKKGQKFNSVKCVINGKVFDSKAEGYRYQQLDELLQKGEITDLQCQVKYHLLPAQREPDIITPKGKVKPGKLIERPIDYVADFVYYDKDGNIHVEDVKGFRDTGSAAYKVFILKRKLLLYFHNLKVEEVTIPQKILDKWVKENPSFIIKKEAAN